MTDETTRSEAQFVGSALLTQLIAIALEKMLPIIVDELKELLGIESGATIQGAQAQGLLDGVADKIAELLTAQANAKLEEILAVVQVHSDDLKAHDAKLDELLELVKASQ